MNELTDWLADPVPDRFPHDAVIDEFHRVGKHFVSEDLLKSLALGRELLARQDDDTEERQALGRFLDTALDKWDGRYDYPSYTAQTVLGLTVGGYLDRPADPLLHRDRLVVQLLADLVRFELAAAQGRTALFPEMRPEPMLVEKRCRLAVRVARPALERLGLGGRLTADSPEDQAEQLRSLVDGELLDPRERTVLRQSMMPVYTSHDEHMFIRVLQTFETTFALLALSLRQAIGLLDSAHPAEAVARLAVAEHTLAESAPLFSLLATMQVESFRTFREFTEGASAIQSRNYKLLESLCRTPDQDRLHSPAYRSTPEVHERILAGQPTLDESCARALADPRFSAADRALVTEAMQAFASTLRRWRQTHYRLAVRMLGARSGTGYTEGTPYLSAVRSIPVFHTVGHAPDTDAPANTVRTESAAA